MLRLAKGTHLMALPVYLPPSPQAGRPAFPRAAFGPMPPTLHPAARGAWRPAWLTTTAYAVLGVVVAVWLGLLAWALGLAEPRAPPPSARYRALDMATARRARLTTDARREQLVALGVEIFSERPFDEVSIDDIAASAGISKGLLYHYFPSKRDFYVAVVRHSADEMQAVTETGPTSPARAPVGGPGPATWSTSRPTRAATPPCCGPASARTARSRPSSRTCARRWRGGSSTTSRSAAPPPPGVRIAVRGWVGFAEAASLEWLERRELTRDELRDLLIQALTRRGRRGGGAFGGAVTPGRHPGPRERANAGGKTPPTADGCRGARDRRLPERLHARRRAGRPRRRRDRRPHQRARRLRRLRPRRGHARLAPAGPRLVRRAGRSVARALRRRHARARSCTRRSTGRAST